MNVQACDFTNSFLHFEIDHEKMQPITVTTNQPTTLNQVRIALECRCEVTNPDSGDTAQYVLAASCKTEKVNVDRDIWLAPNADFCVVSSDEEFLIIKRCQQCDMQVQRESAEMAEHLDRQVSQSDMAWTTHHRDIHIVEARQLDSPQQVTDATLSNRPLVSRTEFEMSNGHHVMIEYPVKTINVSQRHDYYQVDTGPVLYPDPKIGHQRFVGNFRLAYIAHNGPHWAEFIINVSTPVADGVNVHHFSHPVRVNACNSMLELVGS